MQLAYLGQFLLISYNINKEEKYSWLTSGEEYTGTFQHTQKSLNTRLNILSEFSVSEEASVDSLLPGKLSVTLLTS